MRFRNIILLSSAVTMLGLTTVASTVPVHADTVTTSESQLVKTALHAVNQTRAKYGRKPLKLKVNLNQIANKRAHQIVTNFSHYNHKGQGYANQMITPKMHISNFAENISMIQNTENSNDTNIRQSINDMYYHDAASQWGHRKNFLNRQLHHIGIGVYITSNHTIYMAFDLSN